MSFLKYFKENIEDIEHRKQSLEAKINVWKKEKQNFIKMIEIYAENIEKDLVKLKTGIDYTGNIQSKLNGIKSIFEKIRDTEKSLDIEKSNLEIDENE